MLLFRVLSWLSNALIQRNLTRVHRDLSYWQKYQKNEPKTEETLSQAKKRGQGGILEGSYKIEAGSIQFCAYSKVHRFLCKFESGGPSFKFCAQSSLLCIRVVSPSAGSRWSSSNTTPTAGGQELLLLHLVQVVK